MSLALMEPPATPTTIVCTDPATGERLGEVPALAPEDVRAAVEEAREAQERWARTSFAERRAVLGHILDHVVDHAEELVDWIVRDAGKTRENAIVEVWPVCEKLRHTMAKGERFLRPERVSSGFLVHKKARIEFHPLGVIGIIAPWNYPLQNVFGPAIQPLMAGNAVVIKVSEWTSWSAARFQRIFDEALTAAGQSPALVRILTGYGETGAALVQAGVDQIVFTGSVPNGREGAPGQRRHPDPGDPGARRQGRDDRVRRRRPRAGGARRPGRGPRQRGPELHRGRADPRLRGDPRGLRAAAGRAREPASVRGLGATDPTGWSTSAP